MSDNIKFIADNNVGKLARWLRMVGYDTKLFNGADDGEMVNTAQVEGRIVLTRDTGIMNRRVITRGQVQGILIVSDKLDKQIRQVVQILKINNNNYKPLTLCLECNQPLESRTKAEVKDCVPPYIYKTQKQFVECPACHRIYWKGTHWQAMQHQIENMIEYNCGNDKEYSNQS